MVPKTVDPLRVGPGLTDESARVVSHHRSGVVKRKEGVITDLLQLTLPCAARPATPVRQVLRMRENPRDRFGIARSSVGRNRSTWAYHRCNAAQDALNGSRSIVPTGAVLTQRNFDERVLRRHAADVEGEDLIVPRIDGDRDGDGLAFSVLARLHLVELDVKETARARGVVELDPALGAEKAELARDGLPRRAEEARDVGEVHLANKKALNGGVEPALLLTISGQEGRRRERPTARLTAEALDAASVFTASKESETDDQSFGPTRRVCALNRSHERRSAAFRLGLPTTSTAAGRPHQQSGPSVCGGMKGR